MYPIKFEPIYKEMIWGGKKLETIFGRTLPSAHTGESWDVSCRKNEMSIVANGEFAGMKFIDLINRAPKNFLGANYSETFPLLVKIIDANDNLSVQVHPSDDYASVHENDFFGKTELWYVLDAPENGFLIAGCNCTKEDFASALKNGTVEACLTRIPVKKGDVIFIPPGLIHAITAGVAVAEIQQNSDLTYRVYDYNRTGLDGKPRELHIEKALDVINPSHSPRTTPGLEIKKPCAVLTYFAANQYFAVIKYGITGDTFTESSDPGKFFIFTCVDGECTVKSGASVLGVKKGDSFFIPAALGEYSINGNCSLLKSFVPDVQKDFIAPLKEYGYSPDEIYSMTEIQQP